ncbi:uncharacterized protein [Diadema antillarum]|uniref:uncharacterized protein n=1 Tax=Diadema antillarum TaxID=105358 RepID=UPI003A86AC26
MYPADWARQSCRVAGNAIGNGGNEGKYVGLGGGGVLLARATTDIPTITVFRGDSVEAPCSFEGAVTSIAWKKGPDLATATTVASFEGGVVTGSDNDRITMQPDHSLVIDNVAVSDEGSYFCQVDLISLDELVIDVDIIVAVSPEEPYPTLTISTPNPLPSTNSSCQLTVAPNAPVELSCRAINFRPSIRLEWRIGGERVAGSELKFSDNSDGTMNVYGDHEFPMGTSRVTVECAAVGEAVPDGSGVTAMLVCPGEGSQGGGTNTTMVVIIVIAVLIFVVVVVGLVVWIRSLLKDTMVRSNYSKTVSADDDTPSRSRMSNFCHICCAACCPCLTPNASSPYAETRGGKKSSRNRDEPDRKPRAPSAALKARIQKNRKKQENAAAANADKTTVPSDRTQEDASMLEAASNPAQTNQKPPGARPKTRPADDVTVQVR